MRVLVCGGRNYNNREAIFDALHRLATAHGWLTVIQGGASGADRIAAEWAGLCYHGLVTVRADWSTNGNAAGPIRNEQMLISGKPDLVLAFPGGRGTADMTRRARSAGVEVIEILS